MVALPLALTAASGLDWSVPGLIFHLRFSQLAICFMLVSALVYSSTLKTDATFHRTSRRNNPETVLAI
jgi:hypothetical protein